MKSCDQNDLQTIYDHGVSVQKHLKQLLDFIYDDKELGFAWKIPEWLTEYKDQLKGKILPTEIVLQYALFHDVGKTKMFRDRCKWETTFPRSC